MDAREEALGHLSKIWQKLQALPHADPVELGAFFIILTFICEYFIRALCQLTPVALSNANVSPPAPPSGGAADGRGALRELLLPPPQGEDEGHGPLSPDRDAPRLIFQTFLRAIRRARGVSPQRIPGLRRRTKAPDSETEEARPAPRRTCIPRGIGQKESFFFKKGTQIL